MNKILDLDFKISDLEKDLENVLKNVLVPPTTILLPKNRYFDGKQR